MIDRELITPEQYRQLAQLLTQLVGAGDGHLEIRIEKHSARWFRPSSIRYDPDAWIDEGQAVALPVGEILGAWRDSLERDLRRVMAHGWGSIRISVGSGIITAVETSLDIRAELPAADRAPDNKPGGELPGDPCAWTHPFSLRRQQLYPGKRTPAGSRRW
jgi:hypothetical protein